MLNRRALFKSIVPTLLTLGLASTARAQMGELGQKWSEISSDPGVPFALPPLPYGYAALEPFIDADTMRIHHDKHHLAYIRNANMALGQYPDLQTLSAEYMIAHLDQMPDAIRLALRNNVGGHVNHSWLWETMGPPNSSSAPMGGIGAAIEKDFESLTNFQAAFGQAAMGVFGSGWVWLSVSPSDQLVIETTANQDNPLMTGQNYPILGLDVWEHAYYLKYQNVRVDYVKAFWSVVNWSAIGDRWDNRAEMRKKISQTDALPPRQKGLF